jgi:hypothetical protein
VSVQSPEDGQQTLNSPADNLPDSADAGVKGVKSPAGVQHHSPAVGLPDSGDAGVKKSQELRCPASFSSCWFA